jgi:succinate dehydrogenase/fumarate reductase flavoprotein subunit
LLIAGAGMAGLCAAARARELGLRPLVLEKGDRPGGSMLLSSGVVWRHRSVADFRRACPGGDPQLQRQIVERLDDALDWLESLGAPLVASGTRNPHTVGRRFDPPGLTRTLVDRAGGVQLGRGLVPGTGTAPEEPLVLATGGFPVRLAALLGLPLRANPWSEGDGFDFATERGAAATRGMDEFYGRAMPAPPARWDEADYVALAQLYGRVAEVFDEVGARIPVDADDWSENGLVQEIAGRGGTAWYVVGAESLGYETPYGTVAEAIERVRLAGGTVDERSDGRYAVHVAAAVTHTIGGVAIDDRAHVLGEDGQPVEALYAAGVDAGGIATGGYASGLAAALVFGLIAAEEVAT